MSQMLYRPGSQEVWRGVGYDWIIVDQEEVEELQEQGWLLHPDDLLTPLAPVKKPATKKKAVTDEPKHEE